MVCKRCGAEMPEGSNFCIRCGYKAATTHEENVNKITLISIIVSVAIFLLYYYLTSFSLISNLSSILRYSGINVSTGSKLSFSAESLTVLLVMSALLSYSLVLNVKVFQKKPAYGVISLLINIGIAIKIIIYLANFFKVLFS